MQKGQLSLSFLCGESIQFLDCYFKGNSHFAIFQVGITDSDDFGQVLIIPVGISIVHRNILFFKRFTIVPRFSIGIGWCKSLQCWQNKLCIGNWFAILIDHTEENFFFFLCNTL